MAIAMRHLATINFLFGAASFILGVIAENLKPDSGTPVQGKDVIICKYSWASYRYVLFGFMSLVFLVLSTFVGFRSLSIAYNKKAIPGHALYASSTMRVFFFITWLWTSWGMAFILWPTVTELLHQMRNVHKDMLYQCPTAKTGMLGGGALLALTSSLLCLPKMLEKTTLRRSRRRRKERKIRSSILIIRIFLQLRSRVNFRYSVDF